MAIFLDNYVPVTVVSAVLLFISKEIIEMIRKSRAKTRKKRAFRALIAEEIERNHWAWQSLKNTLRDIQSAYNCHAEKAVFYIAFTKEGRPLFRFKRDPEDEFSGGRPLPTISKDRFNQLLTDIAENDEKLYQLCCAAYDEIAELEHIRSSLIQHLSSDEDRDEWLLSGFIEYGFETLEEALPALDKLYRECTSNPLTKVKIR